MSWLLAAAFCCRRWNPLNRGRLTPSEKFEFVFAGENSKKPSSAASCLPRPKLRLALKVGR